MVYDLLKNEGGYSKKTSRTLISCFPGAMINFYLQVFFDRFWMHALFPKLTPLHVLKFSKVRFGIHFYFAFERTN